MKRFFQPWTVRLAVFYLSIIIFHALCADFLAVDQTGLFSQFSPNSIGSSARYFSPPGTSVYWNDRDVFHHLGTDGLGRDVFSNMIHGARTSLLIGTISGIISLLFGGLLGIMAGYYGNNTIRVSLLRVIFFLIFQLVLIFYAYHLSWNRVDTEVVFNGWLFILLTFFFTFLVFLLSGLLDRIAKRFISLPVDSMVMRFSEIFKAVPTLFLLLFLVAFLNVRSVLTTAMIIGSLSWLGTLRLIRGEILDIKNNQYILNAKLLGFSDFRIVLNHILPNIAPVILTSVVFTISGAILLESSLTFLGIGLPFDVPSWGGLIRQCREDFGAWWLAIFPGLAISLTLFSLSTMAERFQVLSEASD